MKPTICLDFDGVIHSYKSGWKGSYIIPDPPVDGAISALVEYLNHFTVCICTSRFNAQNGEPNSNKYAVEKWLKDNGLPWDIKISYDEVNYDSEAINLVASKPPAQYTLDDRAVTFNGVFPDVEEIKSFKPWNKK